MLNTRVGSPADLKASSYLNEAASDLGEHASAILLSLIQTIDRSHVAAFTPLLQAMLEAPEAPEFQFGSDNRDTLSGTDGSDFIFGRAGDDILAGKAGDDLLSGDRGDDWLNGDAGSDLLLGYEGADQLVGGTGDDFLVGGEGDDTLNGQAGNDALWGGSGDDQLDGGPGQDTLDGGSGDDVLIDTEGGDRLTGGTGKDEFRIGNGHLPDTPKITIFPPPPDFTITDFEVGQDVLTFNFWLSFDDLIIDDTEAGALISVEARAGLVLLEGVEAADLTEESFQFADPELATDLQTTLARSLEDETSPGSIAAVMTEDGYLWTGASGFAVAENNTPVTAEDRFPIASVTKPFTAVVTMQLADEDVLSLEDTMDQWLPETVTRQIPNSDEITIRQLLSHTSGINSFIMSDGYFQDLIENPSKIFQDWTTEDLLAEYVYGEDASFAPGAEVEYNSANYLLLGLIIESATDSTLESQFHDRIIDPLDLDNTFMPGGEIPADYQPGYIDADGDGVFDLNAAEADLDRFGGAGALISNAEDLMRFTQALVGGELVNPNTLNEMVTGGVPEQGVGLGFGYGDDSATGEFFFANGDSYGWTVRLRYDKESETTTLLFRNGVNLTAPEDYADTALAALRQTTNEYQTV
ncbi:MAG: serine hydrolase [Leptolyngbya sp. SIO1E4]|nr:serine hydrolase [Leptolyngbya sp. SIO1E4]